MTVLLRAARTFGWRPDPAPLAPRRTLGWVALAGAAVAALAAAAGAAFRDSPTLLGAALLVAALATVSLTFQGLAARFLARLDAAVKERDTFQTELVAARRTNEEWRNLAYHDDLTGLPNRSLLLDRLGLAIAHSRRLASHLALVFLDLDDFKSVNDSFGHGTGDRLLVELATRVRASVRAGDTVSRFGGDELVVLLDSVTGPEDAAHVAAKVLAAVQAPFRLDGHEIRVAASIGVSVYPGDGTSAAELVSRADAAMYRHKRRERAAPMARDEAFQGVIG